MKKLSLFIACVFFPLVALAQGGNTGIGQESSKFESISQRLTALEKKSDAFNVYLNYSNSFSGFNDGNSWSSAFKLRQLRLEIKGNLSDELYYRFRQKINRENTPGSHDGYSSATDLMMVGLKLGAHFAIEGGKMCQHWGGFDYDENPLYIYAFSDMLNNMDIFMGGVAFYWRPSPSQEFVLEATNPLNNSFEATYGPVVEVAGNSLTEFNRVYGAKHPLSLLVNWNGSFADGKILTRCALGRISQTDNLSSFLANGGIKLNLPTFQCYVDYMYEKNGLDRLGIATNDFGLASGKRLGNVSYTSLIAKAIWQFCPGWNLVAKGTYDTVNTNAVGQYRQSLMGVCALEYFPVKSQDFRIFISGIARNTQFSKESGLNPFNSANVEMGIMYRIKCY